MSYYSRTKPVKTVYVEGTGNSLDLNLDPHQERGVEYRYTNEVTSTTVATSNSAIEIGANLAYKGRQRLKNLLSLRKTANEMARKSSYLVPALRGIAQHSDELENSRWDNGFEFPHVNPIYCYDQKLILTAKMWSSLDNRPVIDILDNTDINKGVGIEFGAKPLFEERIGVKSIGLRHWEGCFDDLKASMCGLECIVGVLTHDIWEVIPHEKTNEFITLFLNNLHSKSEKGVKLGDYSSILEDKLIRDTGDLAYMGSFLYNCYDAAKTRHLSIIPYPCYETSKAEAFTLDFHANKVVPMLKQYSSNGVNHLSDTTIYGYYSELFEYLKTIPATQKPKLSVGTIISYILRRKMIFEQAVLFICCFIQALKSIEGKGSAYYQLIDFICQVASREQINACARVINNIEANENTITLTPAFMELIDDVLSRK